MSEPLDAVIVGVLDEVLAELKAINAKLGNTAQTSKVEVKTSTRGADVTVTVYEGTGLVALNATGDAAVAEYRRVVKALSNEKMDSFVAEANRRGIQS